MSEVQKFLVTAAFLSGLLFGVAGGLAMKDHISAVLGATAALKETSDE